MDNTTELYRRLRYKIPGRRSCAVIGCRNHGKKLAKWLKANCDIHNCPRKIHSCTCQPPYLLYSFPSEVKEPHAWKQWTILLNTDEALNRSELWIPDETSRVCSDHFVDKQPTQAYPYPTENLGDPLKKPRRGPRKPTVVDETSTVTPNLWDQLSGIMSSLDQTSIDESTDLYKRLRYCIPGRKACAVYGCPNSGKKLTKWMKRMCDIHKYPRHMYLCTCQPPYLLFSFPSEAKDPEARKQWTNMIHQGDPWKQKENWTPQKNSRLCSRHFVEKQPTKLNPYPTENMKCIAYPVLKSSEKSKKNQKKKSAENLEQITIETLGLTPEMFSTFELPTVIEEQNTSDVQSAQVQLYTSEHGEQTIQNLESGPEVVDATDSVTADIVVPCSPNVVEQVTEIMGSPEQSPMEGTTDLYKSLRYSMPGRKTCAVTGCLSTGHKLTRWLKDTCHIHNCSRNTELCTCQPPYLLFSFPDEKEDADTRKLWTMMINAADPLKKKENWMPHEYSRVCSRHFLDKQPTSLHPWPTEHLGGSQQESTEVVQQMPSNTDKMKKSKVERNKKAAPKLWKVVRVEAANKPPTILSRLEKRLRDDTSDMYHRFRYYLPGRKVCSVVGCHNSGSELTAWLKSQCDIHKCRRDFHLCTCKPPFLLFTFPSAVRDREAWEQWTKLISRVDPSNPDQMWTPKHSSRVCSKHFVDEQPTQAHPYPTEYLGCVSAKPKKGRKRKLVKQNDNTVKTLEMTPEILYTLAKAIAQGETPEAVDQGSQTLESQNDHDYVEPDVVVEVCETSDAGNEPGDLPCDVLNEAMKTLHAGSDQQSSQTESSASLERRLKDDTMDMYHRFRYCIPGRRPCSVVSCHSSGLELTAWLKSQCDIHNCRRDFHLCTCEPPFLLFTFPSAVKDPIARALWIQCINRVDPAKENQQWEPNYNSRVCSKHFVDKQPTPANPYPTENLGHTLLIPTKGQKRKLVESTRSVPEKRPEVTPKVVHTSERTTVQHETQVVDQATTSSDAANDHNYLESESCCELEQMVMDKTTELYDKVRYSTPGTKSCAVAGCHSKFTRLAKWMKTECAIHKCPRSDRLCTCLAPYLLFPFPSETKDPEGRKQWTKMINTTAQLENNQPWKPIYGSRVCSRHFVDRQPTEAHPYPTENLERPKRDPSQPVKEVHVELHLAPKSIETVGGRLGHGPKEVNTEAQDMEPKNSNVFSKILLDAAKTAKQEANRKTPNKSVPAVKEVIKKQFKITPMKSVSDPKKVVTETPGKTSKILNTSPQKSILRPQEIKTAMREIRPKTQNTFVVKSILGPNAKRYKARPKNSNTVPPKKTSQKPKRVNTGVREIRPKIWTTLELKSPETSNLFTQKSVFEQDPVNTSVTVRPFISNSDLLISADACEKNLMDDSQHGEKFDIIVDTLSQKVIVQPANMPIALTDHAYV